MKGKVAMSYTGIRNHSWGAACVLAGVCLAQMASVSAAETPGLMLAKDGEPQATIVVAEQATRSAQFAAYEIQSHIREITGAILPILVDTNSVSGTRILVGESAATLALGLRNSDFSPQEYLIRFLPETLVLMGRDKDDRGKVDYDESVLMAYETWPGLFDEQATCYAVYDFLERYCDVRWYTPTELGMVLPSTNLLVVQGEDSRRAPAFAYRDLGGIMETPGWLYDIGTSLWGWQMDAKISETYKQLAYPNIKTRYPERYSTEFDHAHVRLVALFLRRMRWGGEAYTCNHSFEGYYDRFLEKNPKNPDVFEGEHPEYFAKGYQGRPPQLCYTSPDVVRQAVQDARDFFDGRGLKYRGVGAGEFFSVLPGDNNNYCKCERCQAFFTEDRGRKQYFSNGYASDYVFQFVNKVAGELRKTHPDKYVSTCAYMTYAYPPRDIELEPNISIQLTLHVRGLYDPVTQDNDLALFRDWVAQREGCPVYLWLYYCFPVERATQGKWRCFPGFFAHGISRAFKMYHKAGIRGAFFNGFGQDVEGYVTGKMLDDPELDVDALLEDYFIRYYGAAAAPMKTMYLKIEEIYSNPIHYPTRSPGESLGAHQTEAIAWECLGTPERMADLARLMEEGQRLAETDLEKRRVDAFKLMVWDYMKDGPEIYGDKKTRNEARYALPRATAVVPRVSPADGDPGKVDWSQALEQSSWYEVDGTPVAKPLNAGLAHDGSHLYIRFEERVDPKSLMIQPYVWTGDDWEIFASRKRGHPYRQLAVGPKGDYYNFARGEGDGEWDSGAVVDSDTTHADRWIVTLSLPLVKLLPGGVKAGETFCMNLVRLSPDPEKAVRIITWSPNSRPHEPERFGDLTLEN